MSWAFNTVPSRLPEVYWGNSLEDIRFKVKIVLGFEHMRSIQQFAHFLKVAAMALGGDSEKAQAPKDKASAQAAFAAVIGG